MKRALAASLVIFLMGGSPALAADGPRHERSPDSGARHHDFHEKRDFDRRGTPGFIWLGHRHDPLWSWDDGFFADLKYRHDRYGYWPYRRGRHRPSGEVDVVSGEAVYHYDRSYPYDHYDRDRHGSYDADRRGYDESASIRCRTQWVWSDRDREQVPVRICS